MCERCSLRWELVTRECVIILTSSSVVDEVVNHAASTLGTTFIQLKIRKQFIRRFVTTNKAPHRDIGVPRVIIFYLQGGRSTHVVVVVSPMWQWPSHPARAI